MADATPGNILSPFLANPISVDFRQQDLGDLLIRLFGNPPAEGASPSIYELLKTIATGMGGSDATAANQVIEIAATNNVADNIGAIVTPAAGTSNQCLQSLRDRPLCSSIESVFFNAVSVATLVAAENAYFVANPTRSVVARSMVVDGAGFSSVLTTSFL